jgi:hypothetical protein
MLKRAFYCNCLEVLVNELKMELSLEVTLISVSSVTPQLLNHSSLNTFANSYQELSTHQVKVLVLQV